MTSTTAPMARMILTRRSLALHRPATTNRSSGVLLTATTKRWMAATSSGNDRAKKKSTPASLLDSAAEYYTSLRYKFATSLTESLSPEERSELLGRLNVSDKTATDTTPTAGGEKQVADENEKEKEVQQQQQQHSIAEAVAAARAEEAQKQSAKWEKEKEALMAEAERAAKARVENELLIQQRRMAFERWKNEVEQQKKQQNGDGGTPITSDKKEEETTASSSETSMAKEQVPLALENQHDHPVLGPAIADLGYKRIHMTSVAALKSLPVWKKQRTYRHSRALSMAQDKLKTLHLGLPGIIALYENHQGTLNIIDGQHRVGMLSILEEKQQENGHFDFNLEQILVEVYPHSENDSSESDEGDKDDKSSDLHAQEIFLEINKAEPVKLVDLPGVRGLSAADRKTINEGAKRLQDQFPDMFSTSQRCRAPHLNLDNLRDALFASDVVKRHNLKTAKALENWMMEQNELLKEKYTGSDSSKDPAVAGVNDKALAKAVKFDFYLGMDSSWLFR